MGRINAMKRVYLNGKRMETKEDAHRLLKHKLHFPDYYGNNLDALMDCLTDVREPTRLILFNQKSLLEKGNGYGQKLVEVLTAATGINPRLQLEFRAGVFR